MKEWRRLAARRLVFAEPLLSAPREVTHGDTTVKGELASPWCRWSIRLLVPTGVEPEVVDTYEAAFREELGTPLLPTVANELRWFYQSPDVTAMVDGARLRRARRAFGAPRFRAIRRAFDGLTELANAAAVEIVGLTDDAAPYFEDLAVGAAAATLDDGEAATIAYALAHAGTALIDERKATRICAQLFPQLQVACTVDVLVHPEVQRRLGADLLGNAVFSALQDGRMGVLPRHVDWIVGLIGEARAALCPSLPRRFRTSPATAKLPADN